MYTTATATNHATIRATTIPDGCQHRWVWYAETEDEETVQVVYTCATCAATRLEVWTNGEMSSVTTVWRRRITTNRLPNACLYTVINNPTKPDE